MKLKGKIIIGAMVLAAISGMQSMAAEKEVYQLGEVLVTANKYSVPDLEIPAATEVISGQQIENMGAKSVMEVMKNIPGFVISESPFGNGNPGIRGISGHMSIMINGIPLNQDYYFQMGTLSATSIDRIEVVKGGSAVLYGSNATTGVINIITKKDSENKIVVGAGDHTQRNVSGYVNAKGLSVAYEHYGIKDAGILSKSTSTLYDQTNMYRDSVNVNYTPNEHWNFMYLYSDRHSDVDTLDGTMAKTGFYNSNTLYDVSQITYTNKDLRVTTYYQDRAWKYFNKSPRGSRNGKDTGRSYGVDVVNKWDLGWTDLTAGGMFENERFRNLSGNHWIERDRNYGAVYFLTDTDLNEKTKFLFGAREVFTGDSGNAFCPSFQLLYKLNNTSSAYINVNKSLRKPDLSKRYGSNATTLPNPDLKSEKAWTYEAGLKKQVGEHGMWKFDVYHMEISDRIYSDYVNGSTGPKMNYNADKYKNTGVELSYGWTVPQGFSYNIGISSSNPKQLEKKAGSSWERAENRLSIHSDVSYNMKNTSVNLFFNYAGQRVKDTDPMFSLDMNVRQKLTENDAVSLKISNVLDRDDYRGSTPGACMQERSWLLSYEHKF